MNINYDLLDEQLDALRRLNEEDRLTGVPDFRVTHRASQRHIDDEKLLRRLENMLSEMIREKRSDAMTQPMRVTPKYMDRIISEHIAMLEALQELVAEHDRKSSSAYILPDTGGIEHARAVLATIDEKVTP